MKVDGRAMRTIWVGADGRTVQIIDQTRLPHRLEIVDLPDLAAVCRAIRDMQVRGAPLIGATAAYGVAIALRDDPSEAGLDRACEALAATRPTAINLGWALAEMRRSLAGLDGAARVKRAWQRAAEICDEDVAINAAIGRHGFELLRTLAAGKPPGVTLNVLTHCNAGWLATVDWGTATAPIYMAHEAGLKVHVWVDETRPRNQGASLTAWELGHHGVPHTVIVDNTGGHLMQHGMVDLCFVGTDRTTATGDVANKIGTYLKALAAQDNRVPFYVCAPSPSIDFTLSDGVREIPIEERAAEEVSEIPGRAPDGSIVSVRVTPEGSPAGNWAFDVTPARLVTGLVTERGVARAERTALAALFPERVAR